MTTLLSEIKTIIQEAMNKYIDEIHTEFNIDKGELRMLWEKITNEEKKKPKTDRTKSAYQNFCAYYRPIIRQENPEIKFGDVSQIIGKKWKTLPEDDKVRFKDPEYSPSEVQTKDTEEVKEVVKEIKDIKDIKEVVKEVVKEKVREVVKEKVREKKKEVKKKDKKEEGEKTKNKAKPMEDLGIAPVNVDILVDAEFTEEELYRKSTKFLKQLCEQRNLKKTGPKEMLIQTLLNPKQFEKNQKIPQFVDPIVEYETAEHEEEHEEHEEHEEEETGYPSELEEEEGFMSEVDEY